jgi:ATP-binding cassette subfamily B protein
MSKAETADAHTPRALARLPLMDALAPDARELVGASFVPIEYEFGETIVAAGDPPDGFYVICSGLARVVGRGDDGQEIALNLLQEGDSFGESGLLDGSPRSVSVRAAADVRALRLDASIFQALTRLHPSVAEVFALQARARRLEDFLRVHSAFSRLPPRAIIPMLQALTVVALAPGELAMREGDPAGPLYIVEQGRLRAYEGAGPNRHDIAYLRSGDFFGELSLYLDLPRAATVEALEHCRLLELDAQTFRDLMAAHQEFRARVEERIGLYERSQPTQVPLDFAELLPADASEAALFEREPDDQPELGAEVPTLEAGPGEPGGEPRAAKRRRFMRRPPFPHVRQIDEMDCGAACVAMICRHFGREVAASHIRMAVGTGSDGTSLRGLQRGGEHVGLEIRTIKASKDRLDRLPLPAIIHWGGNHWVVLYAIDGERIYIADPARSLRRVTRDEVMGKWTGYAALPTSTPRLQEARQGESGLAVGVHPPASPRAIACAGARLRGGRARDAVPGAHPAGDRSRPPPSRLRALVRTHRGDGGAAGRLAACDDGPAPRAHPDRRGDRRQDARLHHGAVARLAHGVL